MTDWVLIFARALALAVWLGGLIVIDFVETPARQVAENRGGRFSISRRIRALISARSSIDIRASGQR
jgi:hypothetical protein